MPSKYTIRFAPESLDEIKQVVDYYNHLSYGLGNRFKQNFVVAVKKLKTNPAHSSIRYDEVRFAVIKKFPYAAHYTIDEENKIVKIQALLAFKRNPDTNWRIRF